MLSGFIYLSRFRNFEIHETVALCRGGGHGWVGVGGEKVCDSDQKSHFKKKVIVKT